MKTLRPYQSAASEAAMLFIDDRHGKSGICVLPTGTGKSLLMADLISKITKSGRRIIMATHVEELIAQNFKECISFDRTVQAGINAASLGKADFISQAVFCSIQTVHKKAERFRHIDVLLIDECHLVSPNGSTMYQSFIRNLRNYNPKMVVVGLTATPFRLDSGMLHEGDSAMFDTIIYDYNIKEAFDDGYLTRPTTKATKLKYDTEGVATRGGEFIAGALEKAVNIDEKTVAAIDEVMERGKDRKSWIMFCSGVDHAEAVAREVRTRGIDCAVVTGDTPRPQRRRIIEEFKAGRLRCISNANVLTTGFDAPNLDLIAMMRPTKSASLYCLDSKTEILTSRGWVGMGDVNEGDCAAAYDIEAGKGAWSRVHGVIERSMEADESWVSYSNNYHNFRVTDKHNMIASTRVRAGWTPYKLMTADKLTNFCAVKVPTAVTIPQVGVPLTDDELYFVGMMMTDGTWSSVQAAISQSERHPSVMSRIEKCLDGVGLRYAKKRVKTKTQFNERYPRWVYHISAGEPRCGVNGKGFRYLMPFLDKDMSPALMQMNAAQFQVFLTGLHDGDGSKKLGVDYEPKTFEICSARRLAVDRISALAAINGWTASVRSELGSRKNPIYMLSLKPQDWRVIGGTGARTKIEISPSTNERVWCIETQHGTIVTRRNGRVTVMGNCQIIGRGTRNMYAPGYDMTTAEGRLDAIKNGVKPNCLVLDFAGNINRFGPIDMIEIKQPNKGSGDAPVKECPECETICHASVRTCGDCGYEFPAPTVKVENKSSTGRIVSDEIDEDEPAEDWRGVIEWYFQAHEGPKGLILKVAYQLTGMRYPVYDWVSLQGEGYAREKAVQWWLKRGGKIPAPRAIAEAIARSSELVCPAELRVISDGKFFKIADYRNPSQRSPELVVNPNTPIQQGAMQAVSPTARRVMGLEAALKRREVGGSTVVLQ